MRVLVVIIVSLLLSGCIVYGSKEELFGLLDEVVNISYRCVELHQSADQCKMKIRRYLKDQ